MANKDPDSLVRNKYGFTMIDVIDIMIYRGQFIYAETTDPSPEQRKKYEEIFSLKSGEMAKPIKRGYVLTVKRILDDQEILAKAVKLDIDLDISPDSLEFEQIMFFRMIIEKCSGKKPLPDEVPNILKVFAGESSLNCIIEQYEAGAVYTGQMAIRDPEIFKRSLVMPIC